MSMGMGMRDEDRGFAVLCDVDGRILRTIRDELGVAQRFRPGATIADLVESPFVTKAREFLETVNHRGAAFGWELAMPVDGHTTPMHFAGAAEAGHLFIVAAQSCSGLARVQNELMLINNEQTNALRTALKDLSLQNLREGARDDSLYEDLTRLNNEMTNLQREMTKKNVELERLNAQKNRFLGMAAHDLRNPLGVILNYSEFLEAEAALDDEQRDFIVTIREASEFMLRLVEDLLDVSSIEAGQLRLDRQPTDLAEFVRRNVMRNGVLAARKNITVEFETPQPMPPVYADAAKLEQVLNNLIGNAVKFSQPGSSVTVRADCADGMARIAVRDQGPGIPATDLPHVFTPFHRTSGRGTAGEQSTGLGLSIVRRIVEGHGGRIWLESVVGQGTTFSVTLPINPDTGV